MSLMLDAAAVTIRSPKARARLSNRVYELHDADGKVDGRRASAKRYRDIIDNLSCRIRARDVDRLREVALSKLRLEQAQVAGSCSLEDTVRLVNVIERREKALRAAMRRSRYQGPMSPLLDHFSRPPARDGGT